MNGKWGRRGAPGFMNRKNREEERKATRSDAGVIVSERGPSFTQGGPSGVASRPSTAQIKRVPPAWFPGEFVLYYGEKKEGKKGLSGGGDSTSGEDAAVLRSGGKKEAGGERGRGSPIHSQEERSQLRRGRRSVHFEARSLSSKGGERSPCNQPREKRNPAR